MNNTIEIWKEVPGYEGLYEISNLGRVKSLEKTYKSGVAHSIEKFQPEKILSPISNKAGYLHVNLFNNSKRKAHSIHKIVAEVFLPYTGLNPDGTQIIGRIEVNHKDEDKTNNSVENLEWCDSKYNCRYGTRTTRIIKKLKRE